MRILIAARVIFILSFYGGLLQQWLISHGTLVLGSSISESHILNRPCANVCSAREPSLLARPHSVTITEFGAVGDGITLNTHAFQNAIFYVHSFADKGGAQLYVPAGKWLTGSFNLTSHLTLFLEEDAVVLGSQDPRHWPVIEPLPSYGRGRELPGGRHISLIHGDGLTDVVITGNNGTIDGQGAIWWQMHQNNTLSYTRPHLIEIQNSQDIVISNLGLINSPFWNIHPVYSRNVFIRNLTILAPHDSPNTDGIDPDSSSDVCIEDCYISTGDEMIAIKSGWDEYGISYGQPSVNITIHRVAGMALSSSGIAIGSEMSGGVSDIYVKEMLIQNAKTGIHLKTSPGRGGFVKNIFVSNVDMVDVGVAIRFTAHCGDHPDDGYDPHALSLVENIFINSIAGKNITFAGQLEGLPEAPIKNICLSNISLNVSSLDQAWNCSYVQGSSYSVYPHPCYELQDQSPTLSSI